ncbi:hypothetical protein ACFRH6_07695, partial [Streptomyces sp. NPDC056749]
MSPAPRKRSRAAARFTYPVLLSLLGTVLYGTAAQAATVTLEAESGRLSGGAAVSTDHSGYTGTGFVGGFTDANKGSASVSFEVNSAEAGAGSVSLRYANG